MEMMFPGLKARVLIVAALQGENMTLDMIMREGSVLGRPHNRRGVTEEWQDWQSKGRL